MNILNTLFLEQTAQSGAGSITSILMILAMFAIFYFFMIRPQSKKQKELQRQREAMQNGDKVVTAGGIHGKIKEIKENTLIVEIANGVSIKVDKGSVYPIVEEAPKKK